MLGPSFVEQFRIPRYGSRVRNTKIANSWMWGLYMAGHVAIRGSLIVTKPVGSGIAGEQEWIRL